jgi:hypothetical protein
VAAVARWELERLQACYGRRWEFTVGQDGVTAAAADGSEVFTEHSAQVLACLIDQAEYSRLTGGVTP